MTENNANVTTKRKKRNRMKEKGLKGSAKHCAYRDCKSDTRYPERSPPGTFFMLFPCITKLKDGMTEWQKQQIRLREMKVERWLHLSGRDDLTLERMKRAQRYTHMCSLHFVGGNGPTEDYPDPVLATLTKEEKKRVGRKRKPPPKQKSTPTKKKPKPKSEGEQNNNDDLDATILYDGNSFAYYLTAKSCWLPAEKLISSHPSIVASYFANASQDGPIKVEECSDETVEEKTGTPPTSSSSDPFNGRTEEEEKSYKCEIKMEECSDDSCEENNGEVPSNPPTSNPPNQLTKSRRSKSYTCEICSDVFPRKAHLVSHKRTHGIVENAHACAECGKSFAKKCSLTDHLNLHTGVRPFVCEVCDQTFYNRDTLRTHRQKHNTEKTFQCQFCSKSFTWRTSLKKHEANHTNAKPFKCDKCARSYFTATRLREHDFSHTGISPHHCDVCGVDFATSFTLKIHVMMLHEADQEVNNADQKENEKDGGRVNNGPGGLKRHECDKCFKKFDRNSKLVKHKKFQCYYVALEALKTKKLGRSKSETT